MLTSVAGHTIDQDHFLACLSRAIRVVPTGFEVDGVPVDSASLLDALGARFTLTYRLRDLPEGLRVTDVSAQQDGFRVTVAGTGVTLSTGT